MNKNSNLKDFKPQTLVPSGKDLAKGIERKPFSQNISRTFQTV